jgi:CheY-like chemotaxis protein
MAQILVLEEDIKQFEPIKQLLNSKGHTAWRVTKTAEALEFLNKYDLDLIISAVNLESSDVFEFLRCVKSSPNLNKIPVVFHCSEKRRCERYANNVITAAARALGARKYILLPEFDEVKLWLELQDCLQEPLPRRDVVTERVNVYALNDMQTRGSTQELRVS